MTRTHIYDGGKTCVVAGVVVVTMGNPGSELGNVVVADVVHTRCGLVVETVVVVVGWAQ